MVFALGESSIIYVSLPRPPIKVLFPAAPSSVLLPLLPIIELSKELPVPFNPNVPVRVRFSTNSPNV